MAWSSAATTMSRPGTCASTGDGHLGRGQVPDDDTVDGARVEGLGAVVDGKVARRGPDRGDVGPGDGAGYQQVRCREAVQRYRDGCSDKACERHPPAGVGSDDDEKAV